MTLWGDFMGESNFINFWLKKVAGLYSIVGIAGLEMSCWDETYLLAFLKILLKDKKCPSKTHNSLGNWPPHLQTKGWNQYECTHTPTHTLGIHSKEYGPGKTTWSSCTFFFTQQFLCHWDEKSMPWCGKSKHHFTGT